MSDIDILAKKNRELTRLKLLNAGLIMAVLGLSSVLGFLVVVSRLKPPSNDASVVAIERRACNDDGDFICVPKKITAGVPFSYTVKATKLLDKGADVRLQVHCNTGTTETIVTISSFYSNIPKGDVDVTRSIIIPVDLNIDSSKECFFRSIATYTFFQIDQNGIEQAIPVVDAAKSNSFELVMPDNEAVTKQPSSGTNDTEATISQKKKEEVETTQKTPEKPEQAEPSEPTPEPEDKPAPAPKPSLLDRILKPINNLMGR